MGTQSILRIYPTPFDNLPRILTAMPPTNTGMRDDSESTGNYRHIAPLVGAALFAILLPVFLILFNVSYITNSEWLYDYGWWRNDIANRTGLPVEELNSGADQIKEYFGSEITPWATIWDMNEKKKYSLHLPDLFAEIAIYDASLTLSVPKDITVQTGLDTLSHALESIWKCCYRESLALSIDE